MLPTTEYAPERAEPATPAAAPLAQLIEDYRLDETRAPVAEAYRNSRLSHGEASPEHAAAASLLALWHFAAGEYAAAETLTAQAVRLAQPHGGVLSADALALQAAFWNSTGRHGRVCALFESGCPGTAARIEYGKALCLSGSPEAAAQQLEQAAAAYCALHGVSGVHAVRAYAPLARAYALQGHGREALSILSACLKNVRRRCGGDHPFTAQLTAQTAEVCGLLGNRVRAARLFNQAEHILLNRLGSRHMLLAEVLAAHARFLAGEHPAAAQARLQYVLMLAEETFGGSHPYVEAAAQELAQPPAAQIGAD